MQNGTEIDPSWWSKAASKVARGNPKPTENAATPAKESSPASEELANSLLKSKDFTYDALEKLLKAMFAEGKSTFRAIQRREKRSHHLVFDAYAHGPFCGITNRTLLCPKCVKYINQFLAKQLPKTMTWSTFALSQQVTAETHTDAHNLAGSTNCAFSMCQGKGGGLYVEDEGGSPPSGLESPSRQQMKAVWAYNPWVLLEQLFSHRKAHECLQERHTEYPFGV